jgi:hypothetical protein
LKSAFLTPRCAGHLLALHIFAIRFADLRYFFPQLGDAFFDGILHGDRVAPHTGWIAVARLNFQSLTGVAGASGGCDI